MKLFDRKVEVRIGPPGGLGRAWSDLRIAFSVERTSAAEPNTAEIQLYNLSDDSIGFIESGGNYVQLLAGYGSPSLIFSGDVPKRGVKTEWSGNDRITTIEAGDGELAIDESVFNWSFDAGATNHQILERIISEMGVGVGTLDVLPLQTFASGMVFMGRARDALQRVVSKAGASWSIQDGALQILLAGNATPETAVLLSPDSGMVGSPTRTDSGIEAVSLMQPGLRPGRLVQIQSRVITGLYRCRKVTHAGDTHGGDFTSSVEAKEV